MFLESGEKSRKTFLCVGWSVCHEVMENVWYIILSSAPSTVPSFVGAQNMFEELLSNFRWPSKEACRDYTRPQAGPRLEITFILRTSAQRFLGSCSPPAFSRYCSPSVAFERTGTPRDSLLYPISESLTDNGQERRPTIKLYFLFQPIERGDKYVAQLL